MVDLELATKKAAPRFELGRMHRKLPKMPINMDSLIQNKGILETGASVQYFGTLKCQYSCFGGMV